MATSPATTVVTVRMVNVAAVDSSAVPVDAPIREWSSPCNLASDRRRLVEAVGVERR